MKTVYLSFWRNLFVNKFVSWILEQRIFFVKTKKWNISFILFLDFTTKQFIFFVLDETELNFGKFPIQRDQNRSFWTKNDKIVIISSFRSQTQFHEIFSNVIAIRDLEKNVILTITYFSNIFPYKSLHEYFFRFHPSSFIAQSVKASVFGANGQFFKWGPGRKIFFFFWQRMMPNATWWLNNLSELKQW